MNAVKSPTLAKSVMNLQMELSSFRVEPSISGCELGEEVSIARMVGEVREAAVAAEARDSLVPRETFRGRVRPSPR